MFQTINRILLAGLLALGVAFAAEAGGAGGAGGAAPGGTPGGGPGGGNFGTPTFGSVDLVTGFLPDPHRVDIREAGGSIPARQLTGDNSCRGYIYQVPDFVLNYTAGTQYPLNIYTISQTDTTLVIRDPAGNWSCNDDSHGLNPAVNFQRPQSGAYLIWTGLYAAPQQGQRLPPADLYISELEPNWSPRR